MNSRLEVVTEALFWSSILPLLRFPRNDFDVVAASKNWCIARRVVVLRNHHEIRHLRDALRNVRVELAIETGGIHALCGIGPVLQPGRMVVFSLRRRLNTTGGTDGPGIYDLRSPLGKIS